MYTRNFPFAVCHSKVQPPPAGAAYAFKSKLLNALVIWPRSFDPLLCASGVSREAFIVTTGRDSAPSARIVRYRPAATAPAARGPGRRRPSTPLLTFDVQITFGPQDMIVCRFGTMVDA
ncbi:hypothetical protein EVAR_37357_1 [Eumeta japonica]|uniref:Uncharacterized protein n=1 Tax=Eumeta variegata TaxID=151549 RepID=A0A4C1X015_EUMVA|nr:hypothetical protein EVAR_37357_1 [Eumeta japonica]